MMLEGTEMIQLVQVPWAPLPPGLPLPLHLSSPSVVFAYPTFPVSFTAKSSYLRALKVSVSSQALSHRGHITLTKLQLSHLENRD